MSGARRRTVSRSSTFSLAVAAAFLLASLTAVLRDASLDRWSMTIANGVAAAIFAVLAWLAYRRVTRRP